MAAVSPSASTTIFRYWPLAKPLPKGWKEAGPLHMPHGKYSRLIQKKPKPRVMPRKPA